MQCLSILQGRSAEASAARRSRPVPSITIMTALAGAWSAAIPTDGERAVWRAVVAALSPVCADKFRALPDAEAKTIALSKVEAWKHWEEFPKSS